MEKVQIVRLIDVFLLGPFMIWFGFKSKGISQHSKTIMIGSGIATIVFNGIRFLEEKND